MSEQRSAGTSTTQALVSAHTSTTGLQCVASNMPFASINARSHAGSDSDSDEELLLDDAALDEDEEDFWTTAAGCTTAAEELLLDDEDLDELPLLAVVPAACLTASMLAAATWPGIRPPRPERPRPRPRPRTAGSGFGAPATSVCWLLDAAPAAEAAPAPEAARASGTAAAADRRLPPRPPPRGP